ncbi:hypothetical protein [Streptomyces sp. NPDC003077]|uniref:hypothetical protein n=1 Tax=Streptomyces sp. NPDC003077 TaxID=3154443 RepID=UPI0033BC7A6A
MTGNEGNELPFGTLVFDTGRRRVGRVAGHLGHRLVLHPPAGGDDWDADPMSVRPATAREELTARLHTRTPKPREDDADGPEPP